MSIVPPLFAVNVVYKIRSDPPSLLRVFGFLPEQILRSALVLESGQPYSSPLLLHSRSTTARPFPHTAEHTERPYLQRTRHTELLSAMDPWSFDLALGLPQDAAAEHG